MEPILAGSISGLVVRTLGGAAGSIPRLFSKNRIKQVEAAVADLTSSARSFTLPILARISDTLPHQDQVKVGEFFRSVEGEVYVRSVAIAILSDEYQKKKSLLAEQLVALLIVTHDLPRQSAEMCSKLILEVLSETFERANQLLQRRNIDLQSEIVRRARAERNARHLESLADRTRLLEQQSHDQVLKTLDFADRYRKLLRHRTSEIIPAYFDVQRRVSIEKIYIQPRFNINEALEWTGSVTFGLEVAATIQSLLANVYRVVVLGDPGAGKSTLAQNLAYGFSNPEHAANAKFGIVPFIISMRSYEEWRNRARGNIVDYICSHINENYHLPVPAGAVQYILLSGRAFVIFDGLDELLDISKRREVTEIVASFAELYSTATVLVTSRTVGYHEAPVSPTQFPVVSLLNFTDDDVARYVSNWFSIDDRLEKYEQEKMTRSFLDESWSVRDIRSNALMLGLMCNLYRGIRTIPRNRSDLYEQCAEMLFERWDSSRGIHTSGPLKAEARSALQDIALWMFTSPHLAGGVQERELRRRLTVFWSKRIESIDQAEEAAKNLLNLWKGRTWILTDVGASGREPELVYKFTHQTFLEFFASVELVRRNPSPKKLWKAIRAHVMTGGWDIVSQLAIQRLDASYIDASDEVMHLLFGECAEADILERINLLSFAARHLDGMMPHIETQRALTRAAIDLALIGMFSVDSMTTYDNYVRDGFNQFVDSVIASAKPSRHAEIEELFADHAIEPDDTFGPLLSLIQAKSEVRQVIQTETVQHLFKCLESSDLRLAGKSFVLLLSLDDLVSWSRSVNPSFSEYVAWETAAVLDGLSAKYVKTEGIAHIAAMSRLNFWVAVTACRNGMLPPSAMVQLCGIPSILCTMSAFGRTFSSTSTSDTSIVEELIGTFLASSSSPSEGEHSHSKEEVAKTLQAIGSLYLESAIRTDSTWMSRTRLYQMVVRHQLLGDYVDEDEVRSNAIQLSDSIEPGVAFGCSVLLASVVEFERWNLVDHSGDQVALLDLGPLQPLERFFAERCSDGRGLFLEYDDGLGLRQEQLEVLAEWAKGDRDFILFADENFPATVK